jgi:hypothetical protein
VLDDAQVAGLLSRSFIPIAVDNVQHPNLTPTERAFLSGRGLEASTQGLSVVTAGGRLLASGGGYEPAAVRRLLERALASHAPEEPAAVELPAAAEGDAAHRRLPPEGGLVFHVTWKLLEQDATEPSATTGGGKYEALFREALGLDRLWARRDEAQELAAGRFPASLARRVARCHLSYVFAGKVAELEVAVEDGRLSAEFASDAGERGRLSGLLEVRAGRVARLEMVAAGRAERVEDFGFAAGLTVIPRGRRLPAALLVRLAAEDDPLARVPPHRAAEKGYLR